MLFLRANVSMHFVERADKRVEFVSSVGNVLGTGNGDRRGRGGEGGKVAGGKQGHQSGKLGKVWEATWFGLVPTIYRKCDRTHGAGECSKAAEEVIVPARTR